MAIAVKNAVKQGNVISIATSKLANLLNFLIPTPFPIRFLRDVGILAETTGAKRNQMFGYKKYIEILTMDSVNMALHRPPFGTRLGQML